jgi:hypothetical protein
VKQKRRGEAVDGEVQVSEIAASNREFAPKIVPSRDPGQYLDRPERIVCQHTAKVLEIGAPESPVAPGLRARNAGIDPRSR